MTNSETTKSVTRQGPTVENNFGMDAPTRQLCDEVRERIHEFDSRARKDIVEIGALLIRVKNELGHGAFKNWLDAEVLWTIRTAQNYMNVVRNIGEKYETVSHLPLTTIYELAAPALSDLVRQELIASITDPENPPVAKIKKRLGDVRAQAKLATKASDLEPQTLMDEDTQTQKVELAKRKVGQVKPEDRLEEKRLFLLVKSWLYRMVELALEILDTVKSYGACDVGVAIGAAAEVIIGKQATENPDPKTGARGLKGHDA